MICHGGLPSYDGVTLNDIKNTFRYVEPPEKGLMCDLLWADPAAVPGHTPSKRGCSMGFGPDVTKRFLKENNLSNKLIIKIYSFDHIKSNKKVTNRPTMVSV